MEMFKNRPCKTCRRRDCLEENCDRWQQWFLNSWEAVHRFAWEQMDERGKREAGHFRYELPHIQASPCDKCVCNAWCDTPCARRLNWWNDRVYAAR